jgi:hypothetical protein
MADREQLVESFEARVVLKLDAIISGANGLAYLVLAGPLDDLLGIASASNRSLGAFLVLFAAVVWMVATLVVAGFAAAQSHLRRA